MTRQHYLAVAGALLTLMGAAIGYCFAVRFAYETCMERWHTAMSYSVVAPPPDDWPGRSQCGYESERTFGGWSFVTPSIPPMPAHYEDEDDWAASERSPE